LREYITPLSLKAIQKWYWMNSAHYS